MSYEYICPMYRHRHWSLIAGLLGIAFLTAGAMFWFVPAGVHEGLPYFHFKRAIGSLIIGFVLVTFAYFRLKGPIDLLVIAFALFAFTSLQGRRQTPRPRA